MYTYTARTKAAIKDQGDQMLFSIVVHVLTVQIHVTNILCQDGVGYAGWCRAVADNGDVERQARARARVPCVRAACRDAAQKVTE